MSANSRIMTPWSFAVQSVCWCRPVSHPMSRRSLRAQTKFPKQEEREESFPETLSQVWQRSCRQDVGNYRDVTAGGSRWSPEKSQLQMSTGPWTAEGPLTRGAQRSKGEDDGWMDPEWWGGHSRSFTDPCGAVAALQQERPNLRVFSLKGTVCLSLCLSLSLPVPLSVP